MQYRKVKKLSRVIRPYIISVTYYGRNFCINVNIIRNFCANFTTRLYRRALLERAKHILNAMKY